MAIKLVKNNMKLNFMRKFYENIWNRREYITKRKGDLIKCVDLSQVFSLKTETY